MLVPISWLRDFVEPDRPVEALAELLTVAGLEVKAISYIGIPGGRDPDRLVWERDKLLVGHILEVSPHPDADRLVLARVDYGAAEPETVVTGAPNLFEYLGRGDISGLDLHAPFALEGATLYDGHQPGRVKLTLKGRALRGVFNRCMLCSEKELGLSEEHEGILLLPAEAAPGTPLQDALGDAVLDIDIIPNIARCASILGVAREVAALTGRPLHEPDYGLLEEGPPSAGRLRLSTEEPALNPRFVAVLIEGVEQKPSPAWMQRRLRLAGQRPINVVVDISNYVMLEMGQPNHTFDLDFLRRRAEAYDPGGPVHIHTRLPHPGEKLTSLDGVSRELEPFNILVTDPAGALSLGGVMGGAESEIGPGTRNVLLEAAAWDNINIRRSLSALKINSEAGFRFSRGVHPSQALLGARRAAELLRRHAGGRVAQGIVDYYPNPAEVRPVRLTAGEVSRLGGLNLTPDEIQALLAALQFEVEPAGDHLLVTSPDFRLDIEGPHDLVEEVLRVYGYDRIPTTQMADRLPPQRGNPELEREEAIKDLLVELGLQEVISYRLTTPQAEARLLAAAADRPDERPYVSLSNPITQERSAMRHSVLSSVLEIAAANSRLRPRLALFELGSVYLLGEEDGLPEEVRRLALVMSGPRERPHWGADGRPEGLDFFDLKGVVEQLLRGLAAAGASFEAGAHPSYRPGRAARLSLGEQHIGWLGEAHPLLREAYDFGGDYPLLAAELDLEALLAHLGDRPEVEPTPLFPAVREDIAVLVDAGVPAAEVSAAIREAGGFLLRDVSLFDVYQGGAIPAGKKSLAYHLTFQSPQRTLNDKEVRRNRERIGQKLERAFGASLRQAT
ncbi:MAG: phenylalanine--tRNA ligase subunit beta [Candidatus Promineifilaceae bacterium]